MKAIIIAVGAILVFLGMLASLLIHQQQPSTIKSYIKVLCKGNVQYYYLRASSSSALAVKYNKDGSIATCSIDFGE